MTQDKIKTPEEILREYIDFEDINGSQSVELLPLTITDIMLEFGKQCFEASREHTSYEGESDYDYETFEDYLKELK